jgi:hypothetical protein
MTSGNAQQPRKIRAIAAPAFGLGAVASTYLSSNTSWRYFKKNLGIPAGAELITMFAVLEIVLLANALGARENLHNPEKNKPGIPGVAVWIISAFAAIPAFSISPDITGGIYRTIFGPFSAVFCFHMALGMELRHKHAGAVSNSVPSVVGREIRERLFARLGLAVRGKSSLQLSQERATIKAAILSGRISAMPSARRTARRGRKLTTQLQRQLRLAGVADDPTQADALLGKLAVNRHAVALSDLQLVSPWASRPAVTGQTSDTMSESTGRPDNDAGQPGQILPALPDTAGRPAFEPESRPALRAFLPGHDGHGRRRAGQESGQPDTARTPLVLIPGQPRIAGQGDDGWSDIKAAESGQPDTSARTAGHVSGQTDKAPDATPGQPNKTPDKVSGQPRTSDPDSPDKWAELLEGLYSPDAPRPKVADVVRQAYRDEWDTATMRAVVSEVLPEAKPDTITKAIRRVRAERTSDAIEGPGGYL